MGLTFSQYSFSRTAPDAVRFPAKEARRKAISMGRSIAGRFMKDTSEKRFRTGSTGGKRKAAPPKKGPPSDQSSTTEKSTRSAFPLEKVTSREA